MGGKSGFGRVAFGDQDPAAESPVAEAAEPVLLAAEVWDLDQASFGRST